VKKKLIMVVDDQEINLTLMQQYLQILGYEAILVQEGQNAVNTALEKKPDAIIMDIVMPGEGGEGIARKLKERPETRSIPVVLITADFMKENTRVADYFIRRPVTGNSLSDLLKKILKE
jgi:two-component system cell cycle response regulator DivK